MVCLVLFCIGGHFALFPNLLKQMYGKQATVLYGVLFTGSGLASLLIVALVLSPIGQAYYVHFYIFGAFSACSLFILLFSFEQVRFQPDWNALHQKESEYSAQIEQKINCYLVKSLTVICKSSCRAIVRYIKSTLNKPNLTD